MPSDTVANLKRHIKDVEEYLQNFNAEEHKDENFGTDQEYTAETLKSGLSFLLSRLSFLVDNVNELENSNKFINHTTPADRTIFTNYLTDIKSEFRNNEYNSIVKNMDKMKLRLHKCGLMVSPEIMDTLERRANKLNYLITTGEENILATKQIREKAEQDAKQLQEAGEKLNLLDGKINEQEEKLTQTSELQNQSQQSCESIEQYRNDVKNHVISIEEFVKEIEAREQQLQQQGQATVSYQEKLKAFEKKHQEKLEESEKLINQARNALGYKTAEGISAAFTERYVAEKAKEKISLLWLVGAAGLLGVEVYIGAWVILGFESIGFGAVMSRIVIMSVMFSGAWFCASQYIRHRNTVDDYGYKSILAKSMVAFLDQFKDPEERARYLQTVLQEIHQDPLRKKHDVDIPASRLFEKLGIGDKEMGKRYRGPDKRSGEQ